jgi:hypothetical protein
MSQRTADSGASRLRQLQRLCGRGARARPGGVLWVAGADGGGGAPGRAVGRWLFGNECVAVVSL